LRQVCEDWQLNASIAQGGFDHCKPLQKVADGELVGHADAAMQPDR
jgi:hypothetical protein